MIEESYLSKNYVICQNATVKDAMLSINKNGKRIAVVVDDDGKLLGVVTDGDIRRFILKNGVLSDNINKVINRNPVKFHEDDYKELHEHINMSPMLAYPIVDSDNTLVHIVFAGEGYKKFGKQLSEPVPVVIMAGGKGTRLHPYTQILPKPLLPINGMTISERIINDFTSCGANDFDMILNYQSGMIRAYFSEITKNYKITFHEENNCLGTAGGLWLLKEKIHSNFFLTNCDILVDADKAKILEHHKLSGNVITIVSAVKNMTVPYGIIKTNENGSIKGFEEKPTLSFLINTGLYVIEPEVVDEMDGGYADMPDIASLWIIKGRKVGVYPVLENNFLDMGQFGELEHMTRVLSGREGI